MGRSFYMSDIRLTDPPKPRMRRKQLLLEGIVVPYAPALQVAGCYVPSGKFHESNTSAIGNIYFCGFRRRPYLLVRLRGSRPIPLRKLGTRTLCGTENSRRGSYRRDHHDGNVPGIVSTEWRALLRERGGSQMRILCSSTCSFPSRVDSTTALDRD